MCFIFFLYRRYLIIRVFIIYRLDVLCDTRFEPHRLRTFHTLYDYIVIIYNYIYYHCCYCDLKTTTTIYTYLIESVWSMTCQVCSVYAPENLAIPYIPVIVYTYTDINSVSNAFRRYCYCILVEGVMISYAIFTFF